MHYFACGFHLMNYVQYVHHLERSVYVHVCECERERRIYLVHLVCQYHDENTLRM